MTMRGPQHYERAVELLKEASYAETSSQAMAKRLDGLIHTGLAVLYATLQAGQLDDEQVREWARHGLEVDP